MSVILTFGEESTGSVLNATGKMYSFTVPNLNFIELILDKAKLASAEVKIIGESTKYGHREV